jgi:hypothetical protein
MSDLTAGRGSLPVEEDHEIWMSLNCGEPDGGCSCSSNPRPDGGYMAVPFSKIGRLLGEHLDRVLGR